MIEQLPLWLASPIAKVILDKFYEGVGSKLGEKAVELLPDKVKQLGQLVWDRCLRGKPGTDALLQKAADGSVEDQKKLSQYLYQVLDSDAALRQETQKIAIEIHQVISNFNTNVNAENVQQIFGGQGLMVTEKQEQPIIQIQGNPTLNFGKSD